ncbi:MAG: tetratricopeptide repeat protein [Saprospiraceae bacterium]
MKSYSTLFFCLMAFTLFGQIKQVSEKEVNLQKVYIEGMKEKLLGNHDEAIVLFQEVLKASPKNDAAAYELAQIYQKTGAILKAKSFARKAVTLDPNNAWYSVFYAEILSKDADFGQAAEIYKNLVAKYPSNEKYYFEWAYMFVRANKPSEAIKVYNQLESKIGVDERIARRKYSLYLAQGKTKKAENELIQLTKAFPYEVEYLQLLAEFYNQNDKENKAKGVFKEILKLDKNDPVANLALAETFKAGNDEGRYLNSIKEVFKNPEVNIDLKIQELIPYIGKMGEYKNKNNIRNQLFDLGETLTIIHPNEAKAFSVYGDLLYHADENERALEVYKSTLERDNSVFVVWEQVFYLLKDMNRGDELYKMTEDAMDIFPNQAIVFYMNAVASSLKKKHKNAIDGLEQSLMMAGRDKSLKVQIYSQLGIQYDYLKDSKKSNEAFDMALSINPRDVATLNSYSYALCERGTDLEKARQMSSNANQLVTNNGEYQRTYGFILFKLEDYKAAERWFKKALDNGEKENPVTLERYGDTLYKLNKVNKAVEYWQKAQSKGSQSSILNKKITDRKLYEQ